MTIEQLAQKRLEHASTRQQASVRQSGQIGTGLTKSNGHHFFGINFGDRRICHDPTQVRQNSFSHLGTLIERVRLIRRNLGVVAKEREVELLDGQQRTANCLHPHIRQVDIEVTGKEATHFGLTISELVQGVVAATYVSVTPTEQDAVLPAELLAQRAGRHTQNLARIGTGVVGPTLARRPVCHPTISHISSPSDRCRRQHRPRN